MKSQPPTSRDIDSGLAALNRSLNFGMTVVTATAFGESSGCLVGFYGQTSIDPLLWGVWISSVNHSYPIVTAAEIVAVHFLDHTQHDLAQHFGSLTGDETDKFAGIDLDDNPDDDDDDGDDDDDLDPSHRGAPLISACRHRIVGRRVEVLYGPTDHSCVLLEPISISVAAKFEPLRINDVSDISAGHPRHSSSSESSSSE